MDLGDFLAIIPPTLGSGPSHERPAEEQAALAVGCGLFPILDFVIVLFADGARHNALALLLPVGFTALSVLLCRRLDVGTGTTILTAFGAAAFCLIASGIAFLLAAIAGFYSMF